MRLDDVWLQTTLNTPNISGVWQIRKCSLVSLKAHQPRQGQSPLAGLLFFIILFVCLKHASLSVANLTLNLLRSTWSSFSFPFWSYSRQTSFLAASIDLSVSQSARMDKSLKFSGLSLSTLKTVRLSIPNKDDVESHPVMACAAGKMLHRTGLRMLQIECTGMKTPILGVCDRTRMKP